MDTTRILLVAQSPVLRCGIRGILENALRVEHLVEAGSALDAAPLVSAADPTLIVIQDALPGVTGVVAAKMLRSIQPTAKIVVLSERTDDEHVISAIRHGADALLPAGIDPADFVHTVRELLHSRAALGDLALEQPIVVAHIVAAMRSAGFTQPAVVERTATSTDLSPGEIAVLDGLVRGYSTREIADHLFVHEDAIKTNTISLQEKLQATDHTTAVVSAVRYGIVDLSAQLPVSQAGAGSEIPSAA